MNIREEIDKIREEGYNEANAEARLCQDILLKAISESSLKRNVTIKGGVVMRNLSKLRDVRHRILIWILYAIQFQMSQFVHS